MIGASATPAVERPARSPVASLHIYTVQRRSVGLVDTSPDLRMQALAHGQNASMHPLTHSHADTLWTRRCGALNWLRVRDSMLRRRAHARRPARIYSYGSNRHAARRRPAEGGNSARDGRICVGAATFVPVPLLHGSRTILAIASARSRTSPIAAVFGLLVPILSGVAPLSSTHCGSARIRRIYRANRPSPFVERLSRSARCHAHVHTAAAATCRGCRPRLSGI